MLRRITRTAVGVTRIAVGLPWQVCLEVQAASGNVWMWVLVEWDATWQRGGWEERS